MPKARIIPSLRAEVLTLFVAAAEPSVGPKRIGQGSLIDFRGEVSSALVPGRSNIMNVNMSDVSSSPRN